jgi:hypothetical protein
LLDELLQALRDASSFPVAKQLIFELEDALTPLQLQQALPELSAIQGIARDVVYRSFAIEMVRRQIAEPYVWEPVAPGVDFYRGSGSAAGRGLIVVLSGRHNRPMLAVSMFLQHLPAQLFDVLLMYDATNSHYSEGIAGYADSLLSLTQKVHADFGSAGYERAYHFGVSSGGFPALRMGLMAPAHRSIAVGGLFQWPINRLLSGETVLGFDPICHCNASQRGNLICIHAALERDINHARRVVHAVRARSVRVDDTAEHNVLFPLFNAGHLRDFNQRLFGYVERDGQARFVNGFGI